MTGQISVPTAGRKCAWSHNYQRGQLTKAGATNASQALGTRSRAGL